jgi:hypothetical protein
VAVGGPDLATAGQALRIGPNATATGPSVNRSTTQLRGGFTDWRLPQQ